jgi:hypothetical protein
VEAVALFVFSEPLLLELGVPHEAHAGGHAGLGTALLDELLAVLEFVVEVRPVLRVEEFPVLRRVRPRVAVRRDDDVATHARGPPLQVGCVHTSMTDTSVKDARHGTQSM